MRKVCNKCREEKDSSCFYKRKLNKDGLSLRCVECVNEIRQRRRDELAVVSPVAAKVCTKCKIEKDLSEFKRDRFSKDGLNFQCKECKRDAVRKRKAALVEKREANPITKTEKVCATCGIEKEVGRFYKSNRYADGFARQCIECRNLLRNSPEAKEQSKKYNKKYNQDHADQIREKNRKWRDNNPEKVRAMVRKRRAIKERIKENYSSADEQFTRGLFGNKCFLCGSADCLAIDHNLPLSKGHPLTRANAVLLCRVCNSSKSTKLPEEFYEADKLEELEKILGVSSEEIK